ncbi:hypothetical protein [Novosphingobium sp. SCN 63-17]|uniref:hypothetical protein n=1 Tax=Novosphingobium sp. SCN 63-17 TaxID=1660120 RepID=UPI0025EC6F6E|nr:hypothetical protein [Novosphingobium sp. SCN 63-17]
MAPAGDGRGDLQPIHRQLAHVNIQVGQQRFIAGRRGFEAGRTLKPRSGNMQAPNIQMPADIGQGPIIQRHIFGMEKPPIRIANVQIADGQRAQQRAFDPIDMQAHAIGKGQARDLRGHHVAPALRRKPDPQRRDQHDKDGHRDPGITQRPAQQGLAGLNLRIFHLLHQNACPIET